MINLTDKKQIEEICKHALDQNYSAPELLMTGIAFLATLSCRIHKENGDDIDDVADFSCQLIKKAAAEIIHGARRR